MALYRPALKYGRFNHHNATGSVVGVKMFDLNVTAMRGKDDQMLDVDHRNWAAYANVSATCGDNNKASL